MSSAYIRPFAVCKESEDLTSTHRQPLGEDTLTLGWGNMRLRSKHPQHSSSPDSSWHRGFCIKQLKTSSQPCYLTAGRSTDQGRTNVHRFQACLMFRLKDRVKMALTDSTEDRLKDLALKWFTETQAPLILHNGNFPEWFQGFISRKDAEDHLRDKELGCFLIRLSEKAVGYILSYKGRDRCRHFVINQSKDGQFFITGDTEMHDTLTSLVEYYQKSPIEPFGEFLSSSCFESLNSEIYDVIQRPGLCVNAMKGKWDSRKNPSPPPETLPVLPSKSSRKPQPISQSQAAPPVPRRGIPAKTFSMEGEKPQQERTCYALLEQPKPSQRTQQPEDDHRGSQSQTTPNIVYSELCLMDGRSKSLPLLDETGVESYRLGVASPSPPGISPNQALRAGHTRSLLGPRFSDTKQTAPGMASSHSLEKLCNNHLYHLAGASSSLARTEWALPNSLIPDNTYEQIPDSEHNCMSEGHSIYSNTYESLEELKSGKSASAATKSDKWSWRFAEHKKK
ncbi:SH2 domain-containing protein 7 isoform X2 [Denticeps clupeoides]|uniref:SH2 domain-containing protein n=1 Tax=Denticeps clupeoides TaxID=299321 RepID=A0AAY4EJK2_9TELE|nr:SH2 domain-containing protein 7 isoform X2 [Denticeps clupeoides]